MNNFHQIICTKNKCSVGFNSVKDIYIFLAQQSIILTFIIIIFPF